MQSDSFSPPLLPHPHATIAAAEAMAATAGVSSVSHPPLLPRGYRMEPREFLGLTKNQSLDGSPLGSGPRDYLGTRVAGLGQYLPQAMNPPLRSASVSSTVDMGRLAAAVALLQSWGVDTPLLPPPAVAAGWGVRGQPTLMPTR
eukprot:gnl/TRDRNA2_/TRDRNA2_166554_c0_seq2.p1 gnl/TRDRNA2_/TRDRNA2_166554_c0~~gnl/TRDRNA2_/TRDRNA2_166554_c0_seq2.p1  ORF type:complete len:144 (+),score=7.99 gnl/TRDRNA2_/TRDRNA2_166554_c0_seq2:139-570(+)